MQASHVGLLDFIAGKESLGQYNAYYRNARQTEIPLTSMTLSEVQSFQADLGNRLGSSAVGRYQFIQTTLRSVMDEMGLSGNERFTPELQDQMGLTLLNRRGYQEFLRGEITETQFGNRLSQEWAALPSFTVQTRKDGTVIQPGQSYHRGIQGNKALIDIGSTRAAIMAATGQGTVISEAPRQTAYGTPVTSANPPMTGQGHSVLPTEVRQQYTMTAAEARKWDNYHNTRERPSIWEGAAAAFDEEWTLAWLGRQKGRWQLANDPNYLPSVKDMARYTEGLPRSYWGVFDNVRSEAQALYARDNALQSLERNRILDDMGMSGVGLRLFAGFSDPAGWAIGAGAVALTGGAGGAALVSERAGRLGSMALNAGIGGATTGALEGYLISQNPSRSGDELLAAVGSGMLLGGSIGALMYNPLYRDNYLAMERLGRQIVKADENIARSSQGSSAGAAQGSPYETLRAESADWLRDADGVAPKPFWGALRFDLAGRGKSSENVSARALFNHLVEDGARNVDGVTPHSVSETATLLNHRSLNRWYSDYQPAFDDYWARNRADYSSKDAARYDFGKQVSSAVRNKEPFADYDPAVNRARTAFSNAMKEWHELMQNPGAIDGRILRGLPGFENTPINPNYVPRINDQGAWQHHLHTYGNRNVVALFANAFRSATGDQLDMSAATRLAEGYVRTQQKLSAGDLATRHRALSGDDMDGLRAILRDETDLSDADLDSMLALFNRADDGSAFTHGKRRAFLDEQFSMKVPRADGSGADTLRVSDFWMNDADQLMLLYSRQSAGRVAMARLQIKNPNWQPGDEVPEFLVNGIRSDADWNSLMKTVGDVGAAQGARDGKWVQTNLQFVYDTIVGRPTWDESSNMSTILRVLRDYNFMRVGNMMGAAQIPEMMNILTQTGVKSFMANIPGYRKMVRNAQTGKLSDAHAAEIEASLSIGTEWQRGWSMRRYDEFENPLTGQYGNSGLAQAERLLQKGGRITTGVSGLSAVNTFLERWAAGAMFDNFYRNAMKPGIITQRRLNFLGLDEAMTDRISAQMRKHAQGNQSGHLSKLNLREWDDLEALNALEMSLFRWTRSVVQNNDLGQMNMMFSSPMGRTILQFRSFMLAAWTKQFMQGVNYGMGGGREAFETFATFAGTTFMAGLVFIARTNIQAAGRSDREEYLKNRLSERNIVAASLQNSSWFTLLAPITETALYAVGQDPLLAHRNSGISNQLWDSPTTDLIESTLGASRVMAGALFGNENLTQNDMRSLRQLAPFQNAMGIMQLFDAGVSKMPER